MDKIICVGKNYLAHARELGDAIPERPVLFLKPPSILRCAETHKQAPLLLQLPPKIGSVHYEAEVVLQVKSDAYNVTSQQAKSLVSAVTVGLDMTLRDRQAEQKKNGHPWTTSKVFVDAAVVGPWVSGVEMNSVLEKEFCFYLNGTLKQKASVAEMMMPAFECVSYISEFFPLKAGDLIFTGTPAGVGQVQPGDMGRLQWGPINYEVRWE